MQLGGTGDVTQEAGDTESHVFRVAQHDQNNCNQTDYSAGNNNAGINTSLFLLGQAKPVEDYDTFVNSL